MRQIAKETTTWYRDIMPTLTTNALGSTVGSAVMIPEPTPGADITLMEGSRIKTVIKVQSNHLCPGIFNLVSVPSMIQTLAARTVYLRLMHLGSNLDATMRISGHRENSML